MRFWKILIYGLIMASTLLLTGCGGGQGMLDSIEGAKVGVSMPTQSLQRWNQDGANLEERLRGKDLDVDVEFADYDTKKQISQIDHMIDRGCKVIIIGAVDGNALSSVLSKAKDAGAAVIAYDRLIMNTDAVSYYATFDNYSVGKMQAQHIVDRLGLAEGKGPFHIEIATGPLDDHNVQYLFDGAMEVLRHYIDNGQLVIRSGQITREQCATPLWNDARAQERMGDILAANYKDTHLDAVLCSNDSVAIGVLAALKENGYGTAGKVMPILTGQDADLPNVKAIVAKEQSMSVFKDTRALADVAVKMTEAILRKKTPMVNNIEDYDNGVKIVPTYILEAQFVDLSNYKKLLIDSGYYTAASVQQ